MTEVAELSSVKTENKIQTIQQLPNESGALDDKQAPDKFSWLKQLVQFSLVGGLNTLVDLLLLNSLLLLFPTMNTTRLLAYNMLAYSLGAINSFVLNKYWTFKHKQSATLKELSRFAITTLLGMGWSTCVLWLASSILHPLAGNATLWANTAKIVSVASSALLSYLGMRLWVFVRPSHKEFSQHA